MDDFYARIRAVVGTDLREKRVAVLAPDHCARMVELLAACGVVRWMVPQQNTNIQNAGYLAAYYSQAYATQNEFGALQDWLSRHHPANEAWEWHSVAESIKPDMVIGHAGQMPELLELVNTYNVPALAFGMPQYAACDAAIFCIPPGAELPPKDTFIWQLSRRTSESMSTWLEASDIAAAIAKALLLEGSGFARPDITRLLYPNGTFIPVGSNRQPWQITYLPLQAAQDFAYIQSSGKRIVKPVNESIVTGISSPEGMVVIVGCGSVGSHVARGLVAAGVRELVLVDGERVAAANPVRQFFHPDQVGMLKVDALDQNLKNIQPDLRVQVFARNISDAQPGRRFWRHILRENQVELVILATGSDAEYMLADEARKNGIPHLAVRCYPRARYWETIIIDGKGSPCLSCLRGHLYTGKAPSLTPEEAAAYTRLPQAGLRELHAEPATPVESGRAADMALRLALAFLVSTRPDWLQAALTHELTCFIGGTYAERNEDGSWAYGIRIPGQVVAYGTQHIPGSAHHCAACGRTNRGGIEIVEPAIDPRIQAVLKS